VVFGPVEEDPVKLEAMSWKDFAWAARFPGDVWGMRETGFVRNEMAHGIAWEGYPGGFCEEGCREHNLSLNIRW
jgi:hypothetical protein